MMKTAYHGGQFWEGIGDRFDALSSRDNIVNADVLDAWFSPPPDLLKELGSLLRFACQTSPPTHANGMERAIAEARGVPPQSVFVGAGSSALMFSAWRQWVPEGARVALLEPTYGEYFHLSREIQGAEVHTFPLRAEDDFRFSPEAWLRWIHEARPSVAVLVNPNNPTGTQFSISALAAQMPSDTLLWVDEAYIDYTSAESAESLAAESPQVIVLKSLSKVFGFSGIRAAYLVGAPERLAALRAESPPWAVSLPAQFLGVKVWEHLDYYDACYRETDQLRSALLCRLAPMQGHTLAACANWVLYQLPEGISADAVRSALAAEGVYVRDAGKTAPSLGDGVIRIAVRPLAEQERIGRSLRAIFNP
jgi:histidinol-phosphate/aromatic aminotransferase/cobyric acid decarboxylase-like protein